MSDDPYARPLRGLVGLGILALPIALVGFVFVAYAGMFALGLGGRAGTEPLALSFEACPEAEPVLRARLEDMGFRPAAAVDPSGVSFTFAGPADPEVRATLPVDLARPGVFEVRAGGEVVATGADVREASVRVDALMVPTTLVLLGEAATERVAAWVRRDPNASIDFFLDGARIGGQSNAGVTRGEVEIAPPIEDPRQRLLATAAWGVLIDHPPLPCPVRPRAD